MLIARHSYRLRMLVRRGFRWDGEPGIETHWQLQISCVPDQHTLPDELQTAVQEALRHMQPTVSRAPGLKKDRLGVQQDEASCMSVCASAQAPCTRLGLSELNANIQVPLC